MVLNDHFMRFLTVLSLVFFFVVPCLAQALPPADEMNVSQEEVARWAELAAEGDALARYWLGKAYLYGWHSDIDHELAFSYFQESAVANLPQGMNALGYCYQRGLGTDPDYTESVKWLQKAAEANEPEAFNNLGNAYYQGWGVEVDDQRALDLYRKAADAGSTKGMYNVAKCYHLGRAVEENPQEALRWFEKAAENDDIPALLYLGWKYTNSVGSTGKDQGVRYLERAAEMGSSEAMVSLGRSFARDEKPGRAARWFEKAAKAGDPNGQFFFGGALLYGEGVKQDRAAAIDWLTKAAKQGHRNAQEFLDTESRKDEV
jgi:uncharacterized protein